MDKVKATVGPALTAAEWEGPQPAMKRDDVLIYDDPPPSGGGTLGLVDDDPDEPARFVVMPEHRHALAALALHGQSFGFTHADLEALDVLDLEGVDRSALYQLAGLRNRIAALLPPR